MMLNGVNAPQPPHHSSVNLRSAHRGYSFTHFRTIVGIEQNRLNRPSGNFGYLFGSLWWLCILKSKIFSTERHLFWVSSCALEVKCSPSSRPAVLSLLIHSMCTLTMPIMAHKYTFKRQIAHYQTHFWTAAAREWLHLKERAKVHTQLSLYIYF